MRIEKDSIGTLKIEEDAYYGIQSLRGSNNFNVIEQRINADFIKNIARIKKAAAKVNHEIGHLDQIKCNAIIEACQEIIDGKIESAFIVDAIQGGAGTSANMNANEVIANRAIEILGGQKGDYSLVHPNDDVNMAQSTNDVIPSAAKMTIIDLFNPLLSSLENLVEALLEKAKEFDHVIKMGRTQMQDAVPIRLGQEFNAYASCLKRDIKNLKHAEKQMHVVNMGGSAIGTSINVDALYLEKIAQEISSVCGYNISLSDDLIDSTQNFDGFVYISSVIRNCAVNLGKIAGDIILMSSGPKTGFCEINIPAVQSGSSIMPGKINPVIPEVVLQVMFLIIGHDVTISMAASSGQLELNAFGPVVFYQLFEAIYALNGAIKTFTINCIKGITANEDKCRNDVLKSTGLVTVLVPIIGYQKSTEIAKESLETGVSVREIILRDKILSKEKLDELFDPYKMTSPHNR